MQFNVIPKSSVGEYSQPNQSPTNRDALYICKEYLTSKFRQN